MRVIPYTGRKHVEITADFNTTTLDNCCKRTFELSYLGSYPDRYLDCYLGSEPRQLPR